MDATQLVSSKRLDTFPAIICRVIRQIVTNDGKRLPPSILRLYIEHETFFFGPLLQFLGNEN